MNKHELRDILKDVVNEAGKSILDMNVRIQMKAEKYGLMGTARKDFKREFDSGDDSTWEAPPSQIKTSFAQNMKGMFQAGMAESFLPALLQYEQMEKAEKMLAESPTGKALMETSEKGHVLTRLDSQLSTRGAYLPAIRVIALNPAQMGVHDGVEAFRATMTHVLGHEHFHAFQHRHYMAQPKGDSLRSELAVGSVHDASYDPRESMLNHMHMEAAAHAVQAQIGWELKDKYPEVMQGLENDWQFAPIMKAYKDAATSDPDAVSSGRAMRAAHDAWFSPDCYKNEIYQQQAVSNYKSGLTWMEERLAKMDKGEAAIEASKIGSKHISSDQIRENGQLPGGVNYMKLPGSHAPDSHKYQQAFVARFEQELSGIYDRVNDIRSTYVAAPKGPSMEGPGLSGTSGLSGPSASMNMPAPSAPKMGGGGLGL